MSEPKQKKKQRKEIDPVFKQLVVSLSERHNFPLETQVEVGRLPRTIDVVIRLDSPYEIYRVSKETAFIELCSNNQIEFKSIKESLGVKGYQYIRARTYLYMADHGLSAKDMSVTIVCSQTPHNLLLRSQNDVEFEEIAKGYYRSKDKPPVILIATNSLPLEEKNYPLILFASHERQFRALLQKMAKEGNWSYLGLAYRLRPKITEKEVTMFQDPYLTEDDLAFIAEDIGPQLLKYLKAEEVVAHYKPEEVLSHYPLKELKAYVLKQVKRELEESVNGN